MTAKVREHRTLGRCTSGGAMRAAAHPQWEDDSGEVTYITGIMRSRSGAGRQTPERSHQTIFTLSARLARKT